MRTPPPPIMKTTLSTVCGWPSKALTKVIACIWFTIRVSGRLRSAGLWLMKLHPKDSRPRERAWSPLTSSWSQPCYAQVRASCYAPRTRSVFSSPHHSCPGASDSSAPTAQPGACTQWTLCNTVPTPTFWAFKNCAFPHAWASESCTPPSTGWPAVTFPSTIH